jgi:hypothetical protein
MVYALRPLPIAYKWKSVTLMCIGPILILLLKKNYVSSTETSCKDELAHTLDVSGYIYNEKIPRVRNSRTTVYGLIIITYMHFSPISSDTNCLNVGNFCNSSTKESNNVIIEGKWIFLEAYNCIKNLILWNFNTCTIGQTTQIFGVFNKFLTLWMIF